jgi:membrane protease YdiL (CAAX protease family)
MLPRESMKQLSLAAALPVLLLVAAAAFEILRVVVMVVLLAGLLASLAGRRGRPGWPARPAVLAWAGCLVVSVNLAWDSIGLPTTLPSGANCTDLFSPFALLRAAGAIVVLGCLVVLVRLVGSTREEIGLRWPSRAWVIVSLAALPAIAIAAALIGPALAEPFFGRVPSAAADLGPLAPAAVFAIANSLMEEAAYRGALLRWLTPSIGLVSALALQAAVFGLAHGVGTDFIGSPLPVMAATAAAGLVLGALAIRTNSLLLPIALHIALDIPVYYGKACGGT